MVDPCKYAIFGIALPTMILSGLILLFFGIVYGIPFQGDRQYDCKIDNLVYSNKTCCNDDFNCFMCYNVCLKVNYVIDENIAFTIVCNDKLDIDDLNSEIRFFDALIGSNQTVACCQERSGFFLGTCYENMVLPAVLFLFGILFRFSLIVSIIGLICVCGSY